MKRLVIFALLIAAAASAQETTTTAPPARSHDALMKAAADAKQKRKKSTLKVITNADVKKSKGKLIILDTPKGEKPAQKPAQPQVNADEAYRKRQEADAAVAAAQKTVDDLRKQTDSLEQRYYEENDPTYRDEVIRPRFDQTKRQLDKAEHALADARDARERLEPKSNPK